jgi:hypothetical protein
LQANCCTRKPAVGRDPTQPDEIFAHHSIERVTISAGWFKTAATCSSINDSSSEAQLAHCFQLVSQDLSPHLSFLLPGSELPNYRVDACSQAPNGEA